MENVIKTREIRDTFASIQAVGRPRSFRISIVGAGMLNELERTLPITNWIVDTTLYFIIQQRLPDDAGERLVN